jgi:hypothetical protein
MERIGSDTMTQTVTLEMPGDLVLRAQAVAKRTGRRFEDVLVSWISPEDSPETLSDEEVLALCDAQMPEDEQQQLTELLDRQREAQLAPADRPRLDELMDNYRRDLVRKAQALQVAVTRGLRPPLGAE